MPVTIMNFSAAKNFRARSSRAAFMTSSDLTGSGKYPSCKALLNYYYYYYYFIYCFLLKLMVRFNGFLTPLENCLNFPILLDFRYNLYG